MLVFNTHKHKGAVFQRNHTGQTTGSNNGVGSINSDSWQGYEVITGRIISQNLGICFD